VNRILIDDKRAARPVRSKSLAWRPRSCRVAEWRDRA